MLYEKQYCTFSCCYVVNKVSNFCRISKFFVSLCKNNKLNFLSIIVILRVLRVLFMIDGDQRNQFVRPIVLTWTGLYREVDSNFKNCANQAMESCSQKCLFTNNRRMIGRAKALIFFGVRLKVYNMPKFRPANQLYVHINHEPPFSPVHLVYPYLPNGMFNITLSYQSDSDIQMPYGRLSLKANASLYEDSREDMFKKKKKSIVWLISKCETHSKREVYVKELSKYIDIDIFGPCGEHTCKRNETELCEQIFSEKYYFYIAFENSVCNEYVTEKFWRALAYDIVPIVLRKADYPVLNHYDTFIAADQFPSPQKLAEYLKHLILNRSLYLSYFKWKDSYYSQRLLLDFNDKSKCLGPGFYEVICKLCEVLHETEKKFHDHDLAAYWLIKERNSCQPGFASKLAKRR